MTFGAESWCIPCQRFAPHFLAASEKFAGVDFAHVDIDQPSAVEIVGYFGIQQVPTVILFAGDLDTWKYLKSRTAPALINEIEALTYHY